MTKREPLIYVLILIMVLGVVAVAGIVLSDHARSERCATRGGVYLSSGDCVRPGVVIEVGR